MENKSTKQEQYARQKVRLKQALKHSFFYEAVWIEYAMFEDRTTSIIKHLNHRTTNRRGNPLKLSEKLNMINDDPTFQESYIKKRLPRELIEQIRLWKEKRDQLVHDLIVEQIDDTITLDEVRRLRNSAYDIVRKRHGMIFFEDSYEDSYENWDGENYDE